VKVYSRQILVFGRETFLCQILIKRFKIIGYEVFFVPGNKRRFPKFKKLGLDFVIIDELSAQTNSYNLQYKIHQISEIPVIKLTPTKVSDKIIESRLALNYCFFKPLSLKRAEILVNPTLKSSQLTKVSTLTKERPKLFYINNLIIDLTKKQVLKNNVELKLTVIQFNLLKLLTDNIGKGLKRSTILFHIWGYIPERDVDTRLIDVHISRLRSKIEEIPNKPDLIITVRGVGYMLNPSKI
jgi:OmpR family response regulator RpaB